MACKSNNSHVQVNAGNVQTFKTRAAEGEDELLGRVGAGVAVGAPGGISSLKMSAAPRAREPVSSQGSTTVTSGTGSDVVYTQREGMRMRGEREGGGKTDYLTGMGGEEGNTKITEILSV